MFDRLNKTASRLVLASASPQRRKILADAGYQFEVFDPGEVENTIEAAPTPEALAIGKARAKAMHIAAILKPPFPALVVGVDTIVVLDGDIIGKPLDRIDAAAILSRLSGTRHRVISGMCLWRVDELSRPGGFPRDPAPLLVADTTWVKMRKMTVNEIDEYVASGESDGKAGAYAIQEKGDRFVESLDGSLLNVIGFPLELFQQIRPDTVWES